MEDVISMQYSIPDVEHEGDVSYEENKLRSMGAEITDTEISWGDEEIDEAIIYFMCPKSKEAEFYNYGADLY